MLGLGTAAFLGKNIGASTKDFRGIAGTSEKERRSFVGEFISLDTFLLNLSSESGYRVLKVDMKLGVSREEAKKEIKLLQKKIRDIVVVMLSGKSYEDFHKDKDKQRLLGDIKYRINLFLTKGRVDEVYFTHFSYAKVED